MTGSETFDVAVAGWRHYQDAPWGRLRYLQAEANLVRHMDTAPLRVLDVAGGNGRDAVPLALRGHQVTVVDYSTEMLKSARETAQAAGVDITTVQADVTALPFEPESFDVVLCHNLVQYFVDPSQVLPHVLLPLRSGGLLSLISLNRDSELLRLALHDQDPVAALAALDRVTMTTKAFGTDVTLSTPDEMIRHLRDHEAKMLSWYGMRVLGDYMSDDERKHDPDFFEALLRLESAVAHRSPYRDLARMYHLIAVK